MFTHAQIWQAIDRLAALHRLSASGLARKAGLSATIFNPSKRQNGKRKRWPSTESISEILIATSTDFVDFVGLMTDAVPPRHKLPILSLAKASWAGAFDENGLPRGNDWDEIDLPGSDDAFAFALEISGKAFEPIYRDGDRLILSPGEKPRRGDRVALRTPDGDILIRTLTREGLQRVELQDLAGAEPPVTFLRRDLAWMHRILWASQ